MKKVTRTDIQLLWQQAGGDSFDEESFYDEVVQRFAKLIAKQCADLVDVGDDKCALWPKLFGAMRVVIILR